MTSKPHISRLREIIAWGTYDPFAGSWRAHYDAVSRDEALAIVDGLVEQLETAQRILVEERRWREEYRAALEKIADGSADNDHAFHCAEWRRIAKVALRPRVSSPASERES